MRIYLYNLRNVGTFSEDANNKQELLERIAVKTRKNYTEIRKPNRNSYSDMYKYQEDLMKYNQTVRYEGVLFLDNSYYKVISKRSFFHKPHMFSR